MDEVGEEEYQAMEKLGWVSKENTVTDFVNPMQVVVKGESTFW